MYHSLIKIFVLSLLILAFLGQGIANASMPCKLMMSSDKNHQSHMSMAVTMNDQSLEQHSSEHHNHHESTVELTQDTSKNSHQDCCDMECACPATSGNSNSLFSDNQELPALKPSSSKISLYAFSLPVPIKKSLYRPPSIA